MTIRIKPSAGCMLGNTVFISVLSTDQIEWGGGGEMIKYLEFTTLKG